jgi:NhaP-type Na+/H+ or K+/H+ antiporter
MQTGKRILALIGAILLICLFGATLILSMLGSAYTFDVLIVSIVACAIVPAMIWVYQWIYKVMKRRRDDNNQQ